MKKTLPFLLLLWATHLLAQPTYKIDLNQSIGHEWGIGLWDTDSFAILPIPESGAEQVWDFAFLGNEDNGNGVLFSEADSLGDFFTFYSFNDPSGLPTAGGGTVQDSFPNAIGCLLTDFFAYERYGVAMGQMGDEVITYGNVEEVNGIFETDDEGGPHLSIGYPLPQQLDESLVRTNLTVEENTFLNTLDSVFSYDSTIYLGYGTIKMFYGDLENVIMARGYSETETVSHDLNTGAWASSSISRSVSYDFYQSGNLMPVLSYFFSVDADGQPTFDGPTLGVFVPFFSPINSTNENRRTPLSVNIAPNPTLGDCKVSFELGKAGPVRLEMISLNGKQVLEKNLGHLGVGTHEISLNIPEGLPTGLYFLKTILSNGQSGSAKVIIE